jgi:hypothetical protein
MADQWNKTNLPASRYVWLPIDFKDGKIGIAWRDSWPLNQFHEAGKPARKTAAIAAPLQTDSRSALVNATDVAR